MWSKRKPEDKLHALLARVALAKAPTPGLVAHLVQNACPRLQISPDAQNRLDRLVRTETWIELGFWLIALELPDWSVHRLSRDDTFWCCSINVRGLAIDWFDDFAEFQHDNLALVLFGALIMAQLGKASGRAPSNVTVFHRIDRADPVDRSRA